MAETIKKVLEIEVDVDSGDVKALEKDVEGVAKGTEKAQKGVNGLSGGFKKVGTAMKAAGIGLIVALLAKLADSLGSNQKAADFFSTAMTALSIAFNDFFGFINDNIGTVTDYFKAIFDDPLGAIKNLGSAIQEGLIKRFDQFVETLGYVGTAIKKLFEGDFTGAWDSAKEAAVQAVDIITGEDGGLESITNAVNRTIDAVSNYTKSTIASAQALTEQAKAMQFSEVASRRLQLEFQKEAELLRQIRDDETKTFQERIEANEKLGEILKQAIAAEQLEVQSRIDFLIRQNSLLGETQERLVEIENLRVDQLDIEERLTGMMSEQLTNRNSLLREQRDLELANIKAIEDARIKAAEDEADRIKKLKELEEEKQAASFRVAGSTLSAIAALNDSFSEGDEKNAKAAFQRQKALGIAAATVSTAEAAIGAYKSTVGIPIVGPFLAVAAAAAAVGAGLAQINTIRKQQFTPSGGGGSSVSASASAPTTQVTAPQFNTVGASGVNQLDESINAQNTRPVQAYVVSTQVSTAQSLDRNRIKEASFP